MNEQTYPFIQENPLCVTSFWRILQPHLFSATWKSVPARFVRRGESVQVRRGQCVNKILFHKNRIWQTQDADAGGKNDIFFWR